MAYSRYLCVALVACACNGSGNSGATTTTEPTTTSDGTSASTDAGGSSSSSAPGGSSTGGTTTTSSDPWPECDPPGHGWYSGYHLGVGAWPIPEPPDITYEEVEHGICSVDDVFVEEAPGDHEALILAMTCTHPEGDEHALRGAFVYDAVGDRLDFLVGRDNLQLDFQNTGAWFGEFAYDNMRLRDENGVLLLAASDLDLGTGTPGDEEIGAPMGWEDPATWFAPFGGFTMRDGLCPEIPQPGYPEDSGATIRRLAIDAETEIGTYRVFDRDEHVGIELPEGTYDLIVGELFLRVETTCGSCLPTKAQFIVVRTGEGTGGTDTGTTSGTTSSSTGTTTTTTSSGS